MSLRVPLMNLLVKRFVTFHNVHMHDRLWLTPCGNFCRFQQSRLFRRLGMFLCCHQHAYIYWGIRNNGDWYRWIPIGDVGALGILENGFGDISMIIKMSTLKASAGFSEEHGVAYTDWWACISIGPNCFSPPGLCREFLARLSTQGIRVSTIPIALVWYRRHSGVRVSDARSLRSHARITNSFARSQVIQSIPFLDTYIYYTKGQELKREFVTL